MSNSCRCGAPLPFAAALACTPCWLKVPEKLRADYANKAIYKRGAPSYFATQREVVRELEKAAKP